jgi:hypothetical protein
MTSTIIAHSFNGFTIEQRSTDGFINGTAMCASHNKDISDWLKTTPTLELFEALAEDLGLEINPDAKPNSIKTRVATLYPSLIIVKRGSAKNGGGTYVHPDLAVPLAQWCSARFAIQVSRWIKQWLLTGKNPIQTQEPTFDLERLEERLRLKNDARLALTDVCKDWMEYHGWYDNKPRVSKYFAALFDGMNVALTTETSQQMTKRLGAARGKPMKSDELIRDYFPVEELRLYLCTHNVLTNTLLDLPQGERDAMKYLQASVKLALPKSFKPKRIEFKLLPYNHQPQLLLK